MPTKQIPMIAPDGTPGMVDAESAQQAADMGYRPGMHMTAPDGTPGIVKFEDLKQALGSGYKPANFVDPATTQPDTRGLVRSALDASGITGIPYALAHPLTTAAEIVSGLAREPARVASEVSQGWNSPTVGGAIDHALYATPFVGGALKGADAQYNSGNVAGSIGTVLGTVTPIIAASTVPSAVQSLAAEPDAAALKGLKIPATSQKVQGTLRAVDTAKPFLQGADSLADLQDRIGPVKQKIWQPYADALNKVGTTPVIGPNGPTTVADLEAERLQLSAINRGLRTNNPQALALAQQKGLSQSSALLQEQAVTSALDPELLKAGINPKLIRKNFGAVAQIGGKISGRSTVAEPPMPYGLGRLTQLDITQPIKSVPTLIDAGRDILAGRPTFSGKPTDVNIREAFRR